jgi:two-component system response regulator FixJ
MLRSIYVVDDDDGVRASLVRLLSTQPDLAVRSYRNGDAFLAAAPEQDPGVALLDLDMPGSSGLEVLVALQRETPGKYASVMVTGAGNIGTAVKAIQSGALDFIEKPYEVATLLETVDRAFSRLQQDSDACARTMEARAKIDHLSPREREVLVWLIEGRQNKVIAYELGISPRTVEIYRGNLMTKLGVRSLPEALRIAFAAGLIAQP